MGIGIIMLVIIGGFMATFTTILVIGLFIWIAHGMYKNEEYLMTIIILGGLIFIILITIAFTLIKLGV